MTERYQKATDKLVNAFILEKIHHGNSCSCAVGNLCEGSYQWVHYAGAFLTIYNNSLLDSSHFIEESKKRAAKCFIEKATGYSPVEIFRVEALFEGRRTSILEKERSFASLNYNNDPDGFKGLCKVFDYLHTLEDWTEEEEKVNLIELCKNPLECFPS